MNPLVNQNNGVASHPLPRRIHAGTRDASAGGRPGTPHAGESGRGKRPANTNKTITCYKMKANGFLMAMKMLSIWNKLWCLKQISQFFFKLMCHWTERNTMSEKKKRTNTRTYVWHKEKKQNLTAKQQHQQKYFCSHKIPSSQSEVLRMCVCCYPLWS